MKLLNFGSLNTRGIKTVEHNDGSRSLFLSNILSDIRKNNIDVIGIQESHLGEHEYKQNEKDYVCFFVNDENNAHHGAGIIIRSIYNPTFRRISPRVCTASFSIDNKLYLFVSGYAPHETRANKNVDERIDFYNDLQKALKLKTANTITVIALDANAKTSYNPELHPHVLGRFTKGNYTNKNGQHIIHFAAQNDLFLTNTKFQHKQSQRSTWTAPFRVFRTKNGEIRKNPVRNQIDYILIDKKYLQFVTDARSYNNKNTQTDHNLVVMNMKIEFSKLNKPNKSPTPRINEENFKKPELAEKYKEEIIKRQNSAERKVCTDNNEKWTRLQRSW